MRAITLTNYNLKPIADNRQLIKKASASNILRDPENPYVAVPVDPTIPDEPDPLEHIYDDIPESVPVRARGRANSFGSPQELALRMQQQQQQYQQQQQQQQYLLQQQQQQEQAYDVPGRPVSDILGLI